MSSSPTKLVNHIEIDNVGWGKYTPSSVRRSSFIVSTSHMQIILSFEPEAMCLPSCELETTRFPSCENATDRTTQVCPSNGPETIAPIPYATRNCRILWAWDQAFAWRLPLCENATDVTSSTCSSNGPEIISLVSRCETTWFQVSGACHLVPCTFCLHCLRWYKSMLSGLQLWLLERTIISVQQAALAYNSGHKLQHYDHCIVYVSEPNVIFTVKLDGLKEFYTLMPLYINFDKSARKA